MIAAMVLASISCDPERVFFDIEPSAVAAEVRPKVEQTQGSTYRETILNKSTRQVTKAISYKGHEYLVFYYEGPYTVDVEVVEIKD